MNKSKLRKEYEARMGIVEGSLRLFNSEGKRVYFENARYWVKFEYNEAGIRESSEDSTGFWSKYKYNEAGKQVYYENSNGTVRDDRPPKAKIFTDEKGTKYKVEVIK